MERLSSWTLKTILSILNYCEKLDGNPKLSYAKKVKQKNDDMIKIYLTKQEYSYLAENLENPRKPLFYTLPQIQKMFDSF